MRSSAISFLIVLISVAGVNVCQGIDASKEAGESAVAVIDFGAWFL